MEALLQEKALLYVTGKGGVGKTTVAAALGLAAAELGRRTIVCEVAEQDRVSRAFARHGVQAEQEVELAPDLWAITIDPQGALEEWLAKRLGGGAAWRLLAHSHAFQYFVAAAPGARELITIAKVWELAQLERWDRHNRTYDLVIVDAPASGHGLAMLTTPQTFAGIAHAGPISRQASRVAEMLADPERTGYVGVALAEEMPVNETLELERRLHETVGLGLDAIVVNGLWPGRFSAADVRRLRAAAQNGHEPAVGSALRAAVAMSDRAKSQRAHLARLRRHAHAPVTTLPFVFERELGLADYERLAHTLAVKGRRTGQPRAAPPPAARATTPPSARRRSAARPAGMPARRRRR